jgi:thiol:disulfide interchange protein DsbD
VRRAADALIRALAAVVAVCLVAMAAHGAAFDDEPLEPERAFPVSAKVVTDRQARALGIDLRFAIGEGYYLYKERFRVEAPGLPVGPLVLPAGMEKEDPFVGRSRIFRKATTLRLPFRAKPSPGEYELRVTAQGCAEERVCYAPFTQVVRVSVP